jgi:hypothetical protein
MWVRSGLAQALDLTSDSRYGGIFERGSREYTLDDFYSLALDKLDRFICLKPCDVQFAEDDDSSDDDDEDDEDDEDEDDENEDDEDDEDEDEDESGDEVSKLPPKSKKAPTPIEADEKPETTAEEPEVAKAENDVEVVSLIPPHHDQCINTNVARTN